MVLLCRAVRESQLLRNVSKKDVMAFYKSYIKKGGQTRRLLTSQVFPQSEVDLMEGAKQAADAIITDELAFRESRPTY